jgi:HEAT repeat protein
MRARRGKLLTLWSLALCGPVLVGTTLAYKDVLLEYYYIARLGSENRAARESAVRQLGRLRSARAVPHLLDIVGDAAERDGSPELSRAALDALLEIGPAAAPAVAEACRDRERSALFRRRMARMLCDFQPPADLELVALLEDGDPFARKEAADCLWRLPPGDATVRALIRALGDPVMTVRLQAYDALVMLNPEGSYERADLLREHLGSEYPDAARAAAAVLDSMGWSQREDVPLVIDFPEGF